MNFKQELAKRVAKELNEPVEKVLEKMEVPPDQTLGDFALPCFIFGAHGKPHEIAQRLATQIKAPFLEKIETKGPYLNFFIPGNWFR